MTMVISYAREKRPKALTPLYIVYVVSYTFNVDDQAGNMYTYNLYVVSCTLNCYSPLFSPFAIPFHVHARCVHCIVFFWKMLRNYYTMYKFPCTFSHLYVARSRVWVMCGEAGKLLYIYIVRLSCPYISSAYSVLRYALRAYLN